jgi:hypothetical protein
MNAKRRVAVLVLAGGLLLGGATAWAQTGGGDPSRPATSEQAPSTTTAKDARRAAREARKSRLKEKAQARREARQDAKLPGVGNAVHGTLTVRTDGGGYEDITFDRGTVKAVTAGSITIANEGRPDVTITVNADTKVPGAASATDLRTDAPATVISKNGVATQILQRGHKKSSQPD